ncbi:hypothetical protein F5Y12DRAFT_715937 [Xylaria sp. FL1777]|nr:hypothetical protein F5Y12DRAFT_715937 [Xylaria sp. FL1777]
MIRHRSITGDPGARLSMGIVTRQMSTASFDLRPAGDIEILGIATATCLLAFFLCYMLCTGLRTLLYASFAMKTPRKRGETSRSGCEWSATPLSWPQTGYDGEQEDSRTPYLTSSVRITRTKTPWENPITTKKYCYTQIPARRKPLSRRPLQMSNSMLSSNRWKDTALDTEKSWSLTPNATISVLTDTASCKESTAKENGGYSDRSFLQYYSASL